MQIIRDCSNVLVYLQFIHLYVAGQTAFGSSDDESQSHPGGYTGQPEFVRESGGLAMHT